MKCECCQREEPSTRKRPGFGYLCDSCWNGSCEIELMGPCRRPPADEPRIDKRQPWWRHLDLIGPDGRPFLRRRGFDLRRGGGLLLHRIDGPDPGLDLHDHPWWFISIILRGGYTEEIAEARDAWGRDFWTRRTWARWSIHRMPLRIAHRITDVEPGTITLVIRGRKIRRWGFYLPGGWVDWEAYDYQARRPLAAVSNIAGESRSLG